MYSSPLLLSPCQLHSAPPVASVSLSDLTSCLQFTSLVCFVFPFFDLRCRLSPNSVHLISPRLLMLVYIAFLSNQRFCTTPNTYLDWLLPPNTHLNHLLYFYLLENSFPRQEAISFSLGDLILRSRRCPLFFNPWRRTWRNRYSTVTGLRHGTRPCKTSPCPTLNTTDLRAQQPPALPPDPFGSLCS